MTQGRGYGMPTKKPGLSPGFFLPSTTKALPFLIIFRCFRMLHAHDFMATQT